MQVRSKMDALQDEPVVEAEQKGGIPVAAVEAAAAIYWTPDGWQKQSESMKTLVRDEARAKLAVAAPYLIKGDVTNSAITAVAKYSWESRGDRSWNRAGTYDRDEFMRGAQRLLKAAAPHLS